MQSLPVWLQFLLAVVPGVSALFAAAGLLLNVRQSRKTNKQARATLVVGLLKGFTDDKDIQTAFYAIEYEKFSYDSEFHGSELEQKVDKLLRHFANLALSWKSGLIRAEEIKPVQYYIQRVMKNPEIEKYMAFIAEWSSQTQLPEHPYEVLVELSRALSNER